MSCGGRKLSRTSDASSRKEESAAPPGENHGPGLHSGSWVLLGPGNSLCSLSVICVCHPLSITYHLCLLLSHLSIPVCVCLAHPHPLSWTGAVPRPNAVSPGWRTPPQTHVPSPSCPAQEAHLRPQHCPGKCLTSDDVPRPALCQCLRPGWLGVLTGASLGLALCPRPPRP